MTLQNVSELSIEVYDANQTNIASATFDGDQWLSELVLEPGESAIWTAIIEGAESGDLSTFSTEFDATYENVGDAQFTSGTRIVINNVVLVTPFVENGTTLVPLRNVLEGLGAEVEWDPKTQTVVANKNGVTVTLTIGDTFLTVNGEKLTLAVPGKIVNGSTMVPLRAVSESFGGVVAYGQTGNASTISITVQ
ncbi:copper amine oxidase N-terminal domain-containing protein [Paenibacillus sp. TRM 82003]|nr:copper amine oxidase N-terminal domain-containing protein [Paenibacillus sp. TRM 82003]